VRREPKRETISDGIIYLQWPWSGPPRTRLLTALFNICLRLETVPAF